MSTGGVFKVRRRLKAVGGAMIGSGGTAVSEIRFGTVTACVPVIEASAPGSGSIAISGLDSGAKIVFTGGSDVTGGVMIYAACVSSGCVHVGYAAPADTAASTLTFQYIAFS